MRVTTGTAKGIQLQSVPGTETRPISDRVKQAVFSILDTMVRGARFLDLFAGTGGVGIEAL
ncbi:MAG: RsmD family RNA methyltransferase, partial [Halopseudomonas sp.]